MIDANVLSSRQRLLLFVLAAINFLHIMDFMILMPLAPQLIRTMKISAAQFSALVASYSIAAGLASFAGTFFVDRFPRKFMLLACFSGFIAGTFLCGLSGTYALLLAARIVTGLLGGIIGSQVMSLIADTFPPQVRGRATGIVMTGFSAASVLGVPAGLFLGTLSGWYMPFFAIAVAGILVFLLALRVLPKGIRHLASARNRSTNSLLLLKDILSFPPHRMALFFTVMVSFSHFTMVPFLSPYMVSNVGFREIDLSYIYITGGAVTLLSGPLIGRMADRHGAHLIYTGLILMACIPQFFITHLPPVPLMGALSLTTLFFVFSGGRFVPSQTLTINSIDPRYRGGFMSLNSSLMQLSSGMAGFLAGKVVFTAADGRLMNYGLLGFSTIFFSIVTIPIALRLGKMNKKSMS